LKKYTISLGPTIDRPWTSMAPIYLGDVPKGLETPTCYCTVECDDKPYLLLNLYGPESQFVDACIWQKWLVLGFGTSVCFIDVETRQQISFFIRYFRSLYPTDEYMFVTSAWEVYCFDDEPQLCWVSEGELGADGVIISSVQDNRVLGIGEWPPFGKEGYIPFALSLHTGNVCQ